MLSNELEQLKTDYKHAFTPAFLESEKFIEIMTTKSYVVPGEIANEIKAIQATNKPQFERSKAISQLLRDKCPVPSHPDKTMSKAV